MGGRRLTSYLLDTHVWAWSIKFDTQLPPRIAELIEAAESIHVSAITLYEIAQKVRLGKWPDMEAHAGSLAEILSEQGGNLIPVVAEAAQLAGLLEWQHRDPFDRLLAATSIVAKKPIMTADAVFDQLQDRKDWPGRIW
jgi:PIN domain nuclease of toxin-antitoxin system